MSANTLGPREDAAAPDAEEPQQNSATALREIPVPRREDRGLPVLGQILEYAKDPNALYRKHYDHYGTVAPFRNLGKTAVLLLGPDACAEALQNKDKALANEPAWSQLVGPFFNRGLMLIDFEEHHRHRRIMQEAFTRTRLEGYTNRMHPAIDAGVAGWTEGEEFPAYWKIKQLTLDIAADLFMGGAEDTSPAEMDRINKAFIACVQAAAGIVRMNVPLTRWGRAYRGRQVLEEFLRHYLPGKRANPGDDIFSVLCQVEDEDGQKFSDDDIVNHMIFLMMAAHDTSTITATTMLRYLGQNPEWQQRCRDESLELGPAPSISEIEGLTSIDLVMKEALRLQAPVPVLVRYAVEDTVIQGVKIPEGTDVILGIQFTHLMEDYWTDPTAFDPDRFGPERREDKSHRFAWEPFGGGVHKCLGMHFGGLEVKSIMHRLLRDFHWTLDPSYEPPMDYHSLPFPKDGLPITLVRN